MAKRGAKAARSKSATRETRHTAVHVSTLYLLHQAYLSYRSLLDASSRQFDQTPGAAMVLSLIERNAGISAAQLAKWLQVAPQSVNVHIASLIAQELVEREVDMENRRALKLRISDKGRKTLKQSRAAFTRIEAAVSELASEGTRSLLRPVLVELIECIRTHSETIPAKIEAPETVLRGGLNLSSR